MNTHVRINAFSLLGQTLKNIDDTEFQTLAEQAAHENPWFTKENVRMAIEGIIKLLQKERLEQWVSSYNLRDQSKKMVGHCVAQLD